MNEEVRDQDDAQKSDVHSSATLSELMQQVEQLKIELLQSEESRDTLAQSLDFFQEEVSRQKFKRQTEVQALEQRLAQYTSLWTHPEHQALLAQHQSLHLRLEEKTLRESCLQESNNALQEMLTTVQISYSNCEKTLLATQHENRELQSLYQELQQSLTETNQDRVELAQQLAETQQELAREQADHVIRQEQASKALAQHAALKADLSATQLQVQDLAARNQALGQQVQEASKLADQLLVERNQYLKLSNSLQNGMTEMRALLDQTARSKDEVIFWDEITKSIIRKQETAILTQEILQKDASLTTLGADVESMNQEAAQLASRLSNLEAHLVKELRIELEHTMNNHRSFLNLNSTRKNRLEKVAQESASKENVSPRKGAQGLPKRQLLGEVGNINASPSKTWARDTQRAADHNKFVGQAIFTTNTPRKTLTGLKSDREVTQPAKPAELWRLFESLCSRDDELLEKFWASAHVHKELVAGMTCKSPEELKQQIQTQENNRETRLGKRQTTPFMVEQPDWDHDPDPWYQSPSSNGQLHKNLKENYLAEEKLDQQQQESVRDGNVTSDNSQPS